MNYQKWITHFRANRLDRPEPNWNAEFDLPERKRSALAKSLAEYQLGDGGGECRLVARDAEAFRASAEDTRLVVDLWFAEEREHSRLLTGAVHRLRGKFVTDTFAFRMFYACRRLLGVQFEMLVLLIVEIVSTGYYRMIRQHCGDEPIKAMCQLILRDEVKHIEFHRDRLAAKHRGGVGMVWALCFRFLGHACAAFLWLGHGRWLRAIGGQRSELFRHVRRGLANFLSELAHLTVPRGSQMTAASAVVAPVNETASSVAGPDPSIV
ncbi:MAG TPA: ferritin-like domain-containing protein [Chthoniobacteraceae bacterium]|jgi:hypothetical protein|nr:ferritin-like domain-containing protein [Chthoniobacteraceae bacterium]